MNRIGEVLKERDCKHVWLNQQLNEKQIVSNEHLAVEHTSIVKQISIIELLDVNIKDQTHTTIS